MLLWTEKFAIGDPQIDAQHKQLIEYINQLESLSHTTNPQRAEAEFILNLVDFIQAYTVTHFQHEEGCMARHRCPAYRENQDAHQHFLNFFITFKHRFEAEGTRLEVLKELHDTCCAWIDQHILQIDLQLKPCLARAPAPGGRA